MKTVIVKYNAGNVISVTNALHRLGVEPEITDDPEKLASADKVPRASELLLPPRVAA